MSVFFFQIIVDGDDQIYFVRVQTKFSERKQARAKAHTVAADRFGHADFKTRPISEDDVFSVIASGDSAGIEIFTAGSNTPGTGERLQMMEALLADQRQNMEEQRNAIKECAEANEIGEKTMGEYKVTIADLHSEIKVLESQLANAREQLAKMSGPHTFANEHLREEEE